MTVYAGFDADRFPGLPMMARLKRETNLAWCGYYLVAPSHPNAGWTQQRAALIAQGWGLAPIFVGQEVIGPGSHTVTAAQGQIDGVAAANAMGREGFPTGSCVFLDLENGPPFSNLEGGYVEAWVNQLKLSRWQPGVYCSHAMAQQVIAAAQGARIWTFKVPTVAPSEATPPFVTPPVALSGVSSAMIWQRAQNVTLQPYGLLTDLSVATVPDPSV